MPHQVLKWIPLIIVICLMILSFINGWHHFLNLELVGRNYSFLKSYIHDHSTISVLIYILFYVVVVMLSLPVGLVFTVAGGLLFGWKIGAFTAVFAATLGATLLFCIAKSTLGYLFLKNVSPSFKLLREGFNKNALSYMLFLRLVPVFPFFVVNLAPAFLDVSLRTFVLGTFFGIVPATFVFSYAGSSLGYFIEAQNTAHELCLAHQKTDINLACPYRIDTSLFLTRELFFSLLFIGFLALLPVFLKRLKIF